MKGVGFDGDDVVRGEFFLAEREHLVGEGGAEDGGGRDNGRSFDYGCAFAQNDTFLTAFLWGFLEQRFGAVFEERERHVAGSAAEVEGDGLGVLKDGAEEAGSAVPPPAIDAGGEEM